MIPVKYKNIMISPIQLYNQSIKKKEEKRTNVVIIKKKAREKKNLFLF